MKPSTRDRVTSTRDRVEWVGGCPALIYMIILFILIIILIMIFIILSRSLDFRVSLG